jgi:hemin uptake protein HemP
MIIILICNNFTRTCIYTMSNPTTYPSSSENSAPAVERPSQPGISPASGGQPTPVPSAALLRGRKTVDIAHNGMLYTLQATKMGKLILTK